MKTSFIAAAALAGVFAHGAVLAQAASYAIDPSHTFVTFEARHMGTSTMRGRFDKKEGSVTLDRAAKTGNVTITIDTGSVSTGVPPLDTHMKSDDFFGVAKFSTAKFVGDAVTFNGDKVSAVSGTLTMLGKAVPLTLTATNFNCYQNPMNKREVCGGDFEATVTRSKWGMNFGVGPVADDIKLLIQVEAIRQ